MLKEKLKKQNVLGSFLAFPSPEIIEVLGLTGWDVVVIDLEHGSMTRSNLAHLIRAAESVNLSVMVRVPENDPKTILGVLDLGAEGIVVPMVDNAESAAQAVSSIHYPPNGFRGLSQGRAGNYGVNTSIHEYVSQTKDIVLAVQIESATAVDHIEEIASVSGVDIVFVGPSDLSANLHLIGEVKGEKMQTIIKESIEKIKDHHKVGGIFSGDFEMGQQYLSDGYSFILTNVMPHIVSGLTSFKNSILK